MGAMPQLNEAESKFFESGGREMASSLLEGQVERDDAEPEIGTAARYASGSAHGPGQPYLAARPPHAADPASSGVAEKNGVTKKEGEAEEKPARQEKFVPLQALQQERAEKKQLRDELKAYREWQAQLAQRLQQLPAQAAQPAPDPQTKPLDYINHVLGNVQATTAELQQWRQQQEQAVQQRAAMQQTASWAMAQEQEFAKTQPEYPEAYRYAAAARNQELESLGYADPAQRAAIVRQNTVEIIQNALQQGRNPAELVWEYARTRGYVGHNVRPAKDGGAGRGTRDGSVSDSRGTEEAQAKIAAGLSAAGAKLNQGGATGEGEVTAKDLAGITDPDEFEKAWKRVFGKKR